MIRFNTVLLQILFWVVCTQSILFADPIHSKSIQKDVWTQADAYLGQTVHTVTVEGLHRIEKEAIFAKIGLQAGSVLSREKIRADIQTLFNLNYFDEISAQAEFASTGKVNLIWVLNQA